MNLWKALDTLNHELLITKLSANGFTNESLGLIEFYLTNILQRTKTNKSFSKWTQSLQDIAQGSVLGPLLFTISLNDLFFLCYLQKYVTFQMIPLSLPVTKT